MIANTKYPAICVCETITDDQLVGGLVRRHPYLLMGEVTVWSPMESGEHIGIDHYIISNLRNGQTLPGMFHSNSFRYITEMDDFF